MTRLQKEISLMEKLSSILCSDIDEGEDDCGENTTHDLKEKPNRT